MGRGTNSLAWGLAIAGVLAIFGSAVLGDDTIFSGDVEVFESARDRFVAEAWHAGEGIPRWAPGIAGGVSARASQELGTLYPLNLLLAIAATDRAEALGLAIHIIIAVLGARALARALGLEPAAALVVGFAYGFSGALVSEQLTPVYVRSGAWVPWALAGLERASRRELGGMLLAVLSLALSYLAGDAQAPLVVAASALVMALLRGPTGTARRFGALAVAGVAALLASAVQLVPAALAFAESERHGGLSFADATRWSLQPRELLGLALPFAFGSHAAPGTSWFFLVSNEHDRAWGDAVYVGPIVLSLVACGCARVRDDRRARVGLALFAFFLAFALGANAPFYRLLHAVPGLAAFRYPAKLLVPATLGLALLAGVGVESLAKTRRLTLAVLGVLGALAILGTNLTATMAESLGARIEALGKGVSGTQAVALMAPRFAHVALVALAGLVVVLRPKARTSLALAALVAIDLSIAERSGVALAPRRFFTQPPLAASLLAEAAATRGEPSRVLAAESAQRPTEAEVEVPPVARTFVAEREGLCPNTGLGYGILSQGGFLSNFPERVVLLDQVKKIPAVRRAILQGATFVLVAPDKVEEYAEGGNLLADAGTRTLVLLQSAPPWATVIGRSHFVPHPRAALASIVDPAFDPRKEVVLEGQGADSNGTGIGRAQLVFNHLGLHGFEVEVESLDEGWLVVREGYAPGWRASVNGGPEVPVTPADLVFRAVRVPAGRSRVAFRYVAPGETAGLLVTIAALVSIVVLALAWRRRAS
ncbi:MAG TPA: hypothetical protein VFF73_28400 [Planctomycetota bacterium]|nr:hypothetical protein [Planctomycetota bacterium]